jgi:hypothetical protein
MYVLPICFPDWLGRYTIRGRVLYPDHHEEILPFAAEDRFGIT